MFEHRTLKSAKAARMKTGENLHGSTDNDQPDRETRPWNDATKGRADRETTMGWGGACGIKPEICMPNFFKIILCFLLRRRDTFDIWMTSAGGGCSEGPTLA